MSENIQQWLTLASKQSSRSPWTHPGTLSVAALVGLYAVRRWAAGGKNIYFPDLTDKFVVVTGASTGIGYATALELAKLGANVTIACRASTETDNALERLRQLSGNDRVAAIPIDLADLHSVRTFAQQYIASGQPLHILINNAGIMSVPERCLTKDGYELQFCTNHLGHFLLTSLLLPVLQKSAPARVINVSSFCYRMGEIDFENLNSEKSYNPWKVYSTSKLANILHAEEFNRRYKDVGITANSLHPGAVRTELKRHLYKNWMFWVISPLFKLITLVAAKSPWEGAQTTLYCALSEECGKEGGYYYSDCKRQAGAHKQMGDAVVAKKLWEVSEQLVGASGQ